MQHSSLSGIRLGSYKLHECVGKGAFGTVYRAIADDDAGVVALKLANQTPIKALDESPAQEVLTEALAIFSGGYNDVAPSPSQLFELQCQRSQAGAAVLPKTSGPFELGNNSYIVMEFVKGLTLRRLISQGLTAGEQKVKDLDLAIRVFESFAALSSSGLKWHGDLKPDNIILSGAGVRLIDPGYFGALACREGMIPRVVITTPRYYPCLEPDDAFAAAAILWEICMGQPLLSEAKSSSSGARIIGPLLKNWISSEELVGRYFLSPLQSLRPPSETFPQMSRKIDEFLLGALGLECSASGILEKTGAAMPIAEVYQELCSIKASGVTSIKA